MKCAFGENPKRCYQKQGISSRMTNAAKIREALNKAKVYKAKIERPVMTLPKLPAYDQKSEALIPVSVKEYVKTNFPQEIITKIERRRSGVEVELANDYSLKFNSKGKFVGMDD